MSLDLPIIELNEFQGEGDPKDKQKRYLISLFLEYLFNVIILVFDERFLGRDCGKGTSLHWWLVVIVLTHLTVGLTAAITDTVISIVILIRTLARSSILFRIKEVLTHINIFCSI